MWISKVPASSHIRFYENKTNSVELYEKVLPFKWGEVQLLGVDRVKAEPERQS